MGKKKFIWNNVLHGNILNDLVPISRFNKGEANKIFDEVRLSGFKIVVKKGNTQCFAKSASKKRIE